MNTWPVVACVLAFVAAAAAVDLRTRRIPNLLTASAALLGLLLNLWRDGAHGALASGAGALLGLAVFLPFYVMGGFGAGDVKAMGAIGAFLGPIGVLVAATATLLIGGFGALAVLAVLHRSRRQHRDAAAAARHRFPYGFAIACGTALSLLWIKA